MPKNIFVPGVNPLSVKSVVPTPFWPSIKEVVVVLKSVVVNVISPVFLGGFVK